MATVVNKRIAYTSQPLPICVKGLSDDMAALVAARVRHDITRDPCNDEISLVHSNRSSQRCSKSGIS